MTFQNWVPCLLPEISARNATPMRVVNPVLRLKTDILFLIFSYYDFDEVLYDFEREIRL
jgi:hypothetical protein